MTESVDNELVLEATDDLDQTNPAPPEDLSDEEIFDTNNKILPYKKIAENNSAGRLQMRVPDAPDNLIELVYRKKCIDCSAILTTISSALMHYNSVKHQSKIALKFLPHGAYNLPLSKEEIREIETGVCKTAEPSKPGISQLKASKVPFRELVKKFEINEDVRKLDLEFCRLCEAPFSSKVAALQHYSGKKHKKKAENWSSFNPIKPIDTKDDLRCDVCNVISESISQMESHLSGRKHQIKMKAYLQRVNAGAIAPPMSSRGFCDFNNVEREEANPVDPSRFVQESILPKNLSGSFIDKFDPEEDVPQPFDEGFVESNFAISKRPSNPAFENDFGIAPGGRAFDLGHFGGHNSSDTGVGYGGLLRDRGGRSFGGIGRENFEDDDDLTAVPGSFIMDYKPPSLRHYGVVNMQSERFPPIHPENDWGHSLSRPELNSPYAPKFANRMPLKYPVQAFGPTKFKYNRQQQQPQL